MGENDHYRVGGLLGAGLAPGRPGPALAVARAFIDARECTGLYGQATDSAFVTAMYKNALHREPDQAGFDYHLAALKDGLSRASP